MNLSNEIEDELKQVAPYLASFPKSHPFLVPGNYFEEAEMKLSSVINNQKRNEEAILDGLNQHPFNVPDNYFNKLPSVIISKIKSEELSGRKIKTGSGTKKIGDYKLWLAAASLAAILLVSVSLFMKQHPNKIALNSTAIENTASDLLYASEVDDAMVVELYLQNQQQANEENNSSNNLDDDNNFLRDVTDIDPYSITEL